MANITAKTSSNIFYKARCEAATHNEQLSSREGAADYMSIDRGRLYRIESGIAIPYPEEIRLMADLYNAPELENYFCRTMCPLGCEMPKAELANLDRLTVRTLSVFRKIGKTKEMLLDITADGVIDESEKPELDEVVKNLEEVEEIAQSTAVSSAEQTQTGESSQPESLLEGERIPVNTADVYELDRLPGIGPTKAQAIVDYRTEHGPFQSAEQLLEVSGIGEATLEGLLDYITLD